MKQIYSDVIVSTICEILKKTFWIKGKELRKFLFENGTCDYSDLELRKCIQWMRTQGYPIIASSSQGYRYTTNTKEINEYINKRFLELKSEYFNLKNLGTRDETTKQLTLKEFENAII